MREIERIIAQKLLQINAIKLSPQNPYTWASGIKSPIYCDNRGTLSYPSIRNLIKESFGTLSEEFGEFDHISGVATAGIAHGALLADYLNMTFSKKLKRLPDFFGVPNLEKLILKGCEGLTESCFDEFRRLHKS